MDITVDGAVAQASQMFDSEMTYATFKPNFYADWGHTRKCMHPDLTSTVTRNIYDSWKARETKDDGKAKYLQMKYLLD